jgi:hypothetical protein
MVLLVAMVKRRSGPPSHGRRHCLRLHTIVLLDGEQPKSSHFRISVLKNQFELVLGPNRTFQNRFYWVRFWFSPVLCKSRRFWFTVLEKWVKNRTELNFGNPSSTMVLFGLRCEMGTTARAQIESSSNALRAITIESGKIGPYTSHSP